jgi:uncharacterized membrane protein HdeD (DUF308 family)
MATPSGEMPHRVRPAVQEVAGMWWAFLLLGILWTVYGMFVLSYRVGSLAAVAAFVGTAFLFGGLTQFALATWAPGWRWIYALAGILSLIAGVMTFVWPHITLYVVSVFVAWFLIIFGIVHMVAALAGPKLQLWWTQLLLGIAEFVLGVWATRSWERSLLTLVTLVGVWAIAHGVSQFFTAFSLRETAKHLEATS